MNKKRDMDWSGTASNGKEWKLYCDDATEAMKKIPSEEVRCIITSPPYYSLRDYGVVGQIGLEDTVREYIDSLSSVMSEAYRVLHKEGLLFLNLGDTYYSGKGKSHGIDRKSQKRRFGLRPVDKSGGLGLDIQRKSVVGIPWRVAIEMMSQKWILRAPIIWHRDKALPESVQDRPRKSYEYVFMFAKDRKYHFNREHLVTNEIDEDVWTISARPKMNGGINTAPFPDELVKRCLEIGCPPGGLVLDPFVGSGTTMRVALQTGRPVIGIDLSEVLCKHILDELKEI